MQTAIILAAIAAVLGITIGLIVYYVARSQGEIILHDRKMKAIFEIAGLRGVSIAAGFVAFAGWWVILMHYFGPPT